MRYFLYLGRKYSPNRLYPEDLRGFGAMAQWLFFGKTSVDPNLAVARYFTKFLGPADRDEKRLNELRTQGNGVLKVMDDHLERNDFLAGSYSIADIACYPVRKPGPRGRDRPFALPERHIVVRPDQVSAGIYFDGGLNGWSGKRDSNPRPSPWQGDALAS